MAYSRTFYGTGYYNLPSICKGGQAFASRSEHRWRHAFLAHARIVAKLGPLYKLMEDVITGPVKKCANRHPEDFSNPMGTTTSPPLWFLTRYRPGVVEKGGLAETLSLPPGEGDRQCCFLRLCDPDRPLHNAKGFVPVIVSAQSTGFRRLAHQV